MESPQIDADDLAAYLKLLGRLGAYCKVELAVEAGRIINVRVSASVRDTAGLRMWTPRVSPP